jgi:transcription elongation factor Elf1
MAEEGIPVPSKVHLFICPHCSRPNTIRSDAENIPRRWVTCGHCGRQFQVGILERK